MTGGNVINQPRSILQKNRNRAGRIKKARHKKQNHSSLKSKSKDELTTSHILKKTRTNPKANITLSGKKKRLLLKQIKKQQKEQAAMGVVVPEKTEKSVTKGELKNEKMDLDET